MLHAAYMRVCLACDHQAVAPTGEEEPEDLAMEDEEFIRHMMFQSRSKRLDDPGDDSNDAQPGGKSSAPTPPTTAANGHAGELWRCI